MKKMLFLFTVVILAGCKKDTRSVIPSLEGSWELIQTSGSFTTTYSPGTGNILKFTKLDYQRFKSSQLVASGKYSIIKDGNAGKETGLVVAPGQYEYRIQYENDPNAAHRFFNLSKDTLIFIGGFFPTDGGSSSMYRRL